MKINKTAQLHSAQSYATLPQPVNDEIFYLCPDTEIPSAGIRRLYRHVDLLSRAGFEARILHLRSGFLRKDLPEVPVAYLDRLSCRSNTIIVIPEGFPAIMDALKQNPGRRFAIALNWDYVYKSMPEGMNWRAFNIERVLTVSQGIARMISWSMGLPTHVLGSSIDHRLYYPDEAARQPHIVFIARKAIHADILKRLLAARNPDFVQRIKWVGLRELTEPAYAAQVRQASIFLNLSAAEGFPTSCLEAMASGTLVAGYRSACDRELLRHQGPDQNCILTPIGDYVSLAFALEPVLQSIISGNLNHHRQMLSNALNTAREFTLEYETRTLVAFWKDIRANRFAEQTMQSTRE